MPGRDRPLPTPAAPLCTAFLEDFLRLPRSLLRQVSASPNLARRTPRGREML